MSKVDNPNQKESSLDFMIRILNSVLDNTKMIETYKGNLQLDPDGVFSEECKLQLQKTEAEVEQHGLGEPKEIIAGWISQRLKENRILTMRELEKQEKRLLDRVLEYYPAVKIEA